MGDFFRIPNKNRRYLRIDIKHNLQMLAVALQRGHGNHIVQHRSDHIFFLGGSQRAFHDLRIVQHVIDLVGQTLSRQLYGGHIRPDVRGNLFSKRYLADSYHHVNGRAELMGYIG